MPTILRIASFRFHFYSDEGNEPAHIHVRGAAGECKFWLAPRDLRDIERLVFENEQLLIDKYHEYHDH